jgi:hypothetical protein
MAQAPILVARAARQSEIMNVGVASTMTLTVRRTVFFFSSSLYDSRASIQANSKFIKAGPSQPKFEPNFSKENALFSLDFLGGYHLDKAR